MWYTDGHKWKPEVYDQDLDDFLNGYMDADGSGVDADGGGLISNRSMLEARCHGNPFLDTASIMWNDNTEAKRAEIPFYEAEFSTDTPSTGKEYLKKVPPATAHVEGSWYIVDSDDPELVEFGEDYIHRQLTSHYGDLMAGPIESWKPWLRDNVWPYMSQLFFTDIANGFVPAAILTEPVRQHLGLAYEWIGAPVAD